MHCVRDALDDERRALLTARQGVRYHLQAGVSVRYKPAKGVCYAT